MPQAVSLLKKRLWHRCFHMNFSKFLGTPFLKNTSRRLLLQILNDFLKWRQFNVPIKKLSSELVILELLLNKHFVKQTIPFFYFNFLFSVNKHPSQYHLRFSARKMEINHFLSVQSGKYGPEITPYLDTFWTLKLSTN